MITSLVSSIEWVSDCCLTPSQQCINHIMARTSLFSMRWWWGPLCSRSTRWVGFYSASSLKQQSTGRHVAPLGHSILIPSQPVVFACTPYCCVLSGETTNIRVFCLTRQGLEAGSITPPMRFLVSGSPNIKQNYVQCISDTFDVTSVVISTPIQDDFRKWLLSYFPANVQVRLLSWILLYHWNRVKIMAFDVAFNNISVIWWRLVSLVEESYRKPSICWVISLVSKQNTKNKYITYFMF